MKKEKRYRKRNYQLEKKCRKGQQNEMIISKIQKKRAEKEHK